MSQHILVLSKAQMKDAWLDVEQGVEKALEHAHGEITVHDVLQNVMNDKALIWTVVETEPVQRLLAVAVTEIVEYPQLTAFRVLGLAGNELHDWFLKLDEAFQHFARTHGCTRIESACRRGLGRMLANYGYSEAYVTLVKEVGYGQGHRNDEVGLNNGVTGVSKPVYN